MATFQNKKPSSFPSSPAAAASPSSSFSLCRTEELEKVFNRIDGDGRISASELADVLRALGSETSLQEVQDMIAEMDTDGDGSVDFREFSDFHGRRRSSSGAEDELRDAFGVYDIDRDGIISVEELHKVLSRLGEKCSLKDCSRMIKSVDGDGDGFVNFEEFKKMMTVHSNGVEGERKSGRN